MRFCKKMDFWSSDNIDSLYVEKIYSSISLIGSKLARFEPFPSCSLFKSNTASSLLRSLNNIFERTENGHSYKGSLKRFGDQK